MSTISSETAVVYIMVMIAAVDREMTDNEMAEMGLMVRALPAFEQYDANRLITDSENCAQILGEDDGVDTVLGLVEEAIPEGAGDLVYCIACDVAVADGKLTQEELRLLEMIRHRLDVDRLTAAAIERGSVARHRRLS